MIRPHYHFTPPANWLNDPNGLIYYKGEYHLFYQYHPASTVWGPMHWGHAISRDLVNWVHLPIALYPDENGMIFSGSAVVDKHNTAGFGKDAIVAIFTHHLDNVQSQSLAHSNDHGRTWTKYTGNPVLSSPNNIPDFRDPKVFWYGKKDTGHWVMCLAARDEILFYTSPNLIHWSASGALGPGFGSTAGVWETPELFELPMEGGSETCWVLTVGVQDGTRAGGSGTQYFVGHFDGRTFIPESPKEVVLWADFGADYYAAQSWNDEPTERRLMIGWMNNWQYANLIPASSWRGMFSLIRELSLTRTDNSFRLRHQPIRELQSLRHESHHWQDAIIHPGANLPSGLQGNSLEILAEFQLTGAADYFGFRVLVGENEHTTISYKVKDKILLVDRTHSGHVDFKEGFARIHMAELLPINNTIRLHIFVDCSSVEVFASDGLVTFSECVFPAEHSRGLELFAEGGDVLLKSLDIYQLNPATFQLQ